MPATYTHGHHESVLRSHRWRTAENSAAYLLPRLRPGLSMTDVGCGPGTLTADLAARLAPGRVTAIEVSEDVLDLARAEAAARRVSNVDFRVGDVTALDIPDGTFDVVHAHQVLQHVADPVLALREMRRVCRRDGVVAVRDSDYAGFTWFPLVPELDEWAALYQRLARHNGGSPTPAAACCRGPARPASPTSPPPPAPGASLRRPSGPGGGIVGGTAAALRLRPAVPRRRPHRPKVT